MQVSNNKNKGKGKGVGGESNSSPSRRQEPLFEWEAEPSTSRGVVSGRVQQGDGIREGGEGIFRRPAPLSPREKKTKRRRVNPADDSEGDTDTASVAESLPSWDLPRAARHDRTETVIQKAREALDVLGELQVKPCIGPSTTKPRPLRKLCREACSAYNVMGEAIMDIETLVVDGGGEKRILELEEQVRGLKAALARLERLVLAEKAKSSRGVQRDTSTQPLRSSSRRRRKEAEKAATTAPAVAEAGPTTWTEVVRRKGKRQGKGDGPAVPKAGLAGGPSGASSSAMKGGGVPTKRPPPTEKKQGGPSGPKKEMRRPVPRTAAVTITTIGDRSYADLMRKVRKDVDLKDIEVDLDELKVKRARNGGYLLEVSGRDSADRADRLARNIEEVLSGEAVVARPVRRAELRITGLDESISQEELLRAICTKGECSPHTVQMGAVYRAAGGMGAVWVRCPLTAALVLAGLGRLQLGWSAAQVQLLEDRPQQCYRCLSFGHLSAACKSTVVRQGRCFRCGETGHGVKSCTANVRCAICSDEGRNSQHRMGGRACPAAYGKQVGKRKGPPAPVGVIPKGPEPLSRQGKKKKVEKPARARKPPSSKEAKGLPKQVMRLPPSTGAHPPKGALPRRGGKGKGKKGWELGDLEPRGKSPPPPPSCANVEESRDDETIVIPDTLPPPAMEVDKERAEEEAIRESGLFLEEVGMVGWDEM